MKLTKQSLRQMIREARKKVKLQHKGMSQGEHSKALRNQALAVAAGEDEGEYTPIERRMVQDIADVIAKIAAAPDVDLGQYRQQLNTVLTRLKEITGAMFPDEDAKADTKAKKAPAKKAPVGQQEL
tara:strand:+ start:79 stop:456 length:378 start_codon:yes stop_codon:yes gene_type:complete